MQVEKECKFCHQFFFYDDGSDQSLAQLPEHRASERKEKRGGYCPRCIDPHAIPGQNYKKETILLGFRKFLRSKKVDLFGLHDEDIVGMLKQFPRCYSIYTSNSTYRTINVYVGTKFDGLVGEFEMGLVHERVISAGIGHAPPHFCYMREIKCLRCNYIAKFELGRTLLYYLGLIPKRCRKCDSVGKFSKHKRNTSGLIRWKGGSEKSEFSDRAIAKALNISRNDYRRHFKNNGKLIKPEPSLPKGTVIQCGDGKLEIVEAFWDENPDSYSPKYRLICPKCKNTFVCIQKRVNNLFHKC